MLDRRHDYDLMKPCISRIITRHHSFSADPSGLAIYGVCMCGRCLAGIVGWNPARGMVVCRL